MGNKSSHDDSDAASEDNNRSQSGSRRRFLRNKSPSALMSSPIQEGRISNGKDDEGDNNRRMSCNSSNASSDKDTSERPGSLPIESGSSKPDGISKLAKELIIRSQQEQEKKDGISSSVFSKYVCHGCAFLGQALFRDFSKHGKSSKKSSSSPTKQAILSKEQFIAGSQKIMQLIGDEQLLSFYIKIFEFEEDSLNQENVSHFIQSCYQLSRGTTTTNSDFSEEIMQTILAAMFHGKDSLSSKYVIHWMEQNCSRVVTWMHRHLVHRLTVGFRVLQRNREAKVEMELDCDLPANVETPVLDVCQREGFSGSFSPGSPLGTSLTKNFFTQLSSDPQAEAEKLVSQTHLHPMQIWLLGCTLPQVYTRPAAALKHSPSVNGIALTDPRTFITRMIASNSPSNWTILYDSDNDGLSMNRFEHHVMGYRGPTVLFLSAEGGRIFCVAVEHPWRESIQFWGSPNSTIVQLIPEYRVLDRGENMMFYNTSARGYPFGIQMGTDHRNICIEIDKDFSRLSYRKIPYRLEAIQVWGCGNNELREKQLEHKMWEMKQVEKSRNVKLTSLDWNDHPDKCLLEMASHRPNYSQFGNA